MIVPVEAWPEDSATYSILGWPHEARCSCGARCVYLGGTYAEADYECRGTPGNYDGYPSAYGPDRCGKVFRVRRDA